MIRILEGTVVIDDPEEFLKKIRKISEKTGMIIQALDADKLAGEEHIRFAVSKAIRSFGAGTNIANDISKEIMLYAAGTRQINRAMKLGVHKGKNNIVIIAMGESPDLSCFDEIIPGQVLGYRESKKETLMDIFNITKDEIDAVGADKIPELVLERVALVDVTR